MGKSTGKEVSCRVRCGAVRPLLGREGGRRGGVERKGRGGRMEEMGEDGRKWQNRFGKI